MEKAEDYAKQVKENLEMLYGDPLKRAPKDIQQIGQIQRIVNGANEQSTKNYKATVKNNVNKRKIKNHPKKIDRVKRFFVAGLLCLSGFTAGYATVKVPEYEEKAYQNCLEALKEEISESVIASPDNIEFDSDFKTLGSSHVREVITIKIKGEEYRVVEAIDGEFTSPNTLIDEIKNPELVKAVKTVINAKNGNIIHAMRANQLVEDIKNKEVDLSMSKAIESRKKSQGKKSEQFEIMEL